MCLEIRKVSVVQQRKDELLTDYPCRAIVLLPMKGSCPTTYVGLLSYYLCRAHVGLLSYYLCSSHVGILSYYLCSAHVRPSSYLCRAHVGLLSDYLCSSHIGILFYYPCNFHVGLLSYYVGPIWDYCLATYCHNK